MIVANPWLGGRLVTNRASKEVEIQVDGVPHPECFVRGERTASVADLLFKGGVPESLSDWLLLSGSPCFVSCGIGVGASLVDSPSSPFFKVSLVPLSLGGSPCFAVVTSLCHVVGDGHTFYALSKMLGVGASVQALDPTRDKDADAKAGALLGDAEAKLFSSPSVGLVFGFLANVLFRNSSKVLNVLEISTSAIKDMKVSGASAASLPFVSSNDVLSSAFFRAAGLGVSFLAMNLRGRVPGLHSALAGNYESLMYYHGSGDYAAPSDIRKSLTPDAGGVLRRVGNTPMPSFGDVAGGRTAVVSNWATFYEDANMPGGAKQLVHMVLPDPKVRMPFMEVCVIFSPGGGRLALFTNGSERVKNLVKELLGSVIAC